MELNIIKKTISCPDGMDITIETGKLAKQAHGSVVVQKGNAMLLATVVSNYKASDVDFLPLSVDYQEKFASNGKIPGGFLKREGRLSDYEILISRLVDRALRPLFPSDYHCETQVLLTLMSADDNVMPDSLAALGASAALMVSDIPFGGPISEIRIGRIDGEFIVNPSSAQLIESDLDIVVAATEDNILMLEGEMLEVSEEEMLEAMQIAHDHIKEHCKVQKELEAAKGSTVKREYTRAEENEEIEKKVKDLFSEELSSIVAEHIANKAERSAKLDAVLAAYVDALPEDHEEDLTFMKKYFGKLKKTVIREHVLDTGIRLDGRKLDQVRSIWSEVNYLPSPHGSAIFTRGETQALATVTLGTKMDQQMIDGAVNSGYNKFMLHYNFPPFSTGEARFMRGPGRREVGHGNLAHRAIKPMLPDDYPYTLRVVSDVLESNGSSSMATVCAGTLCLMDAGVPLKAPVSGIAMGLISEGGDGRFAVLSDILGDEDHLGDMDFKVTGTTKGITACQMDIKVDGLSYEVLTQALEQAKQGRLHIMEEMMKTLDAPRGEIKSHAPRIEEIKIAKEFIGMLIGPGGKNIQEIQNTTGATITVETVDNVGVVQIFASNQEAMEAASERVKLSVAVPEEGEVYDGKVKSIQPYGAFVEILPGKEGLLHVSEIKWERVEDVSQVLEEGEEIKVKILAIDSKTGKLKLSRKALLPKPENN